VVSVSLDELADQLGPELGVGAGRVDLDVGAAGAFDLAPGVAAELPDGESEALRLLNGLADLLVERRGMLGMYNCSL
jgi:hypothetical protein